MVSDAIKGLPSGTRVGQAASNVVCSLRARAIRRWRALRARRAQIVIFAGYPDYPLIRENPMNQNTGDFKECRANPSEPYKCGTISLHAKVHPRIIRANHPIFHRSAIEMINLIIFRRRIQSRDPESALHLRQGVARLNRGFCRLAGVLGPRGVCFGRVPLCSIARWQRICGILLLCAIARVL